MEVYLSYIRKLLLLGKKMIFISYSSRDLNYAEKIVQALRENGKKVWFAIDSIKVGENYAEAIVDGMSSARSMIILFSSNSVKSKHVKIELNLALDKNVKIYPVRLEDILPDTTMQYYFITSQWYDLFYEEFDSGLDKFISATFPKQDNSFVEKKEQYELKLELSHATVTPNKGSFLIEKEIPEEYDEISVFETEEEYKQRHLNYNYVAVATFELHKEQYNKKDEIFVLDVEDKILHKAISITPAQARKLFKDKSNRTIYQKYKQDNDSHELIKEQFVLMEDIAYKLIFNINTMPLQLQLDGNYLKTVVENGYTHYIFTDVTNGALWEANKDKIQEFLGKRIDIQLENSQVILQESVEDSIPKLLELQDSNKNYPTLFDIKEFGNNKIYFYTLLPEIDLRVWKEATKKKSFRTLFNEPDKIYSLEIYDKTNKELYNEDFYDGQLIALKEYVKIPAKEELQPLQTNILKDGKVFWGYGAGGIIYYTNINAMSHMMAIGATGSGKSNFMNGVILSLLHNIEDIQKIYLIDLKSGIEFNRYNDLESPKVDVFGRATKPSKLLEALYEVEAEMYLREEYMINNNITKLETHPIFVIIDEFAQIDLMYAKGEERFAKEEILEVLIRIGTRARSANIKLIVQTQDPRSVPEDLKKHLMSRMLFKTGKENDKDFTLQNPNLLDEYDIKHTSFDKGRYVFEDYNDGDTKLTELQFPYLKPTEELHLTYKQKAQQSDEELKEKFTPYIETIKTEYNYLAKTKLLQGDDNNDIVVDTQVESQPSSSTTQEDETLIVDELL